MLKNHKKVDVVDSHGFTAALIARIFQLIFRKKTIMTIVAYYGFKEGSLFARIVRWILSSAERIIVESPQSRVELKEIGVDSNKITPFIEWIDLKRFKPYRKDKLKEKLGFSNKFTVLFVGRAIKVKGVDIMLKVAESLKDISFVFISTAGDLVEDLEKAGENFPNVVFIKGVDYSKLHLYYAMADIFVVPSRMEDAPRTAVEAIACGTPTVGSNVGGIPSVVNDTVGSLAEPNPKEFKKKIIGFYNNRRKLEEVTKNCRSYALEHFSSKNAEVFIRIYNND